MLQHQTLANPISKCTQNVLHCAQFQLQKLTKSCTVIQKCVLFWLPTFNFKVYKFTKIPFQLFHHSTVCPFANGKWLQNYCQFLSHFSDFKWRNEMQRNAHWIETSCPLIIIQFSNMQNKRSLSSSTTGNLYKSTHECKIKCAGRFNGLYPKP